MTSSPRSVLLVSSRADKGAGGETYLLRVLRHLDRSRYRPFVVLPADGDLVEELKALDVGWSIVAAEHGWLKQASPWYRFVGNARSRVEQMLELIAREGISLVHTNSNHRIEGALAARLAGVHHLYLGHIEFQHDMPIFRRFPLTPASYASIMGELSSHVVTVSQSVADTFRPQIPADKIQVIHNGLELDDLDAAAGQEGSVRSELGLEPDAVLVSSVGRINPDKGFDFYVEAAHQVLARQAFVHFLLVGGEEVEAHARELRSRVNDLGIGDSFHFLGFRKDVPSLLRQSDVFVLSSRREGHPYVLLEAMGCGCPAVAGRCAGVEETVVPGETGFVTDIGDLDALAEGIGRLAGDRELRARMGAAARSRVEDRFQARDMVTHLMGAYDRTLDKPAPVAGAPAIDLFLDAGAEIGHMGLEIEDLKERLRTLEGRIEPILSNPVTRSMRRARRLFSRGSQQRDA